MTGHDPALQAKLRRIRKILNRNLAADDSPDELLREVLRVEPAPYGLLGWMVAYEEDGRVRDYALSMTYMTLQAPGIPAAAKQKAIQGMLPELRRSIEDKAVPDERKLALGPLLELCGEPLPFEEYRACFADFDAAVEALEKRMSKAKLGLEDAEHFLAEAGLDDASDPTPAKEEQLNSVMKSVVFLIRDNPLTASAIACVVAAKGSQARLGPDFTTRPLDMVTDLGGPAGCWFLSVLAQLPGRDALAKHATALVGMLAEKGIQPRRPDPGTFSHGLVTNVDGEGSRSLVLFYRNNDGRLDGTSWLLNDNAGIKDLWALWGQGEQIEAAMRSERNIRSAPCDLSLARELMGDTLAVHARLGTPPPALALLGWHMFGEAPVLTQTRQPRLDIYAIDDVVRSPEMVAKSDRLIGSALWQSLNNPSEECYAMVLRAQKELANNQDLLEKVTTREGYDQFIGIMERTSKDILLQRMAVNLEVEALAGRADTTLNRLACSTWIALKEKIVPFRDVPYIEGLAMFELEMTVHNVELGHTSQCQANAKMFELQDEMAQFENEQDWPGDDT